MRTRFAPSPTGLLHLGHAHSALFAEACARKAGGQFLLRIEDIDVGRCREEFVSAIITDLQWLGLTWAPNLRRQSEHLDDYARALARLDALGLLYPCFCTRADIQRAGSAPHGPDGPLYPGTCRALPPAQAEERRAVGEPFALRLRMAEANERTGPLIWHDAAQGEQTARPELFGDVVLARKDIRTSYHLAVAVDDALQGVTLVTRGTDLFEASHVHRLLQALLDLPVPCYHHHGLITGPDGRRLAKRDGATAIAALRDQGLTPGQVRALANWTA